MANSDSCQHWRLLQGGRRGQNHRPGDGENFCGGWVSVAGEPGSANDGKSLAGTAGTAGCSGSGHVLMPQFSCQPLKKMLAIFGFGVKLDLV